MILTDDEIRKAAEFAAEQMWPESGYVGWTEDDAVFHRKFVDALLAKLRGGVEVPEPFDDWPEYNEFAEGCGLEDRCITDRYEAMRHGWQSCEDRTHEQGPYFTRDQLLAYGAAQRLAGREQTIEECAQCMEEQDTQAPKYNARAIHALAASPQEQQP